MWSLLCNLLYQFFKIPVYDHSHLPQSDNYNQYESQLINPSVPKPVSLKTTKLLNSNLQNFYQNFRELRNKTDELLLSWDSNSPQIICFSEHHLCKEQIHHLFINEYKLVANYCRSFHKHSGVCIFIQESLSISLLFNHRFKRILPRMYYWSLCNETRLILSTYVS